MGIWNILKVVHVTLGWAPEIFNALDVIMTVYKALETVDPKVVEIGYIQYVIAAPEIRIDETTRHHFALDNKD